MQCVATIERHARAAVSAVTVYTREPKDACLRSAYSRSRKLLIDRDVESTWRPGRVAVLGHAICRRLARIGLRLGRLATVCLSAQHADTVHHLFVHCYKRQRVEPRDSAAASKARYLHDCLRHPAPSLWRVASDI